jgi:hypothetical protein
VKIAYVKEAAGGMRLRDWIGTPRQVVLRLIKSYQDNSSAGHDRCPGGAGLNCSHLVEIGVEKSGALALFNVLWVLTTCRAAIDPGQTCCGIKKVPGEDCC